MIKWRPATIIKNWEYEETEINKHYFKVVLLAFSDFIPSLIATAWNDKADRFLRNLSEHQTNAYVTFIFPVIYNNFDTYCKWLILSRIYALT